MQKGEHRIDDWSLVEVKYSKYSWFVSTHITYDKHSVPINALFFGDESHNILLRFVFVLLTIYVAVCIVAPTTSYPHLILLFSCLDNRKWVLVLFIFALVTYHSFVSTICFLFHVDKRIPVFYHSSDKSSKIRIPRFSES